MLSKRQELYILGHYEDQSPEISVCEQRNLRQSFPLDKNSVTRVIKQILFQTL